MRCCRRASPRHHQRVRFAAIAVSALAGVLVTPICAWAHVVPVPEVLPTGVARTVSFAVPNERPEPMSGVTISVPDGLRIIQARALAGWDATVEGSTATWQGGALEHLMIETFRLEIDVTAAPGVVTLDTTQLYPSKATVSWPATLTVVPGPDEEQSQTIPWVPVAALAGVGLVLTVGLALLARRR
jgi:hypothetical protein